MHHAFLYISLAALHNFDVSNFTLILWTTWTLASRRFSFSFSKLTNRPLEFNSRKVRKQLKKWTRWNKSDEVWNNANAHFKWSFLSRRRRCCFSSILESLSTMATARKISLKKWSRAQWFKLCHSYSISISSSTQFCRWILEDCIKQSSGKEKRKSLSCVRVLHKTWNWVFSRHSSAVTSRKCTEKRDASAELLFCGQSKPIQCFFLPFLLTSPSL